MIFIEHVIGLGFEEIDNSKNIELIEYRIQMLSYVRELIMREVDMNHLTLESNIFSSSFSPNIEINTDNLAYTSSKNFIEDDCIVYFDIAIHDLDDESFLIINASINQKPSEIINEYLKIKQNKNIDMKNDCKTYVLNACGTNDVIYGSSEPLGNFKVEY